MLSIVTDSIQKTTAVQPKYTATRGPNGDAGDAFLSLRMCGLSKTVGCDGLILWHAMILYIISG
jgi:hypothetical protein